MFKRRQILAAAVRHPDTLKRLANRGAEPVGSSPAEQDAILRRQMDQFRPVIREMRLDQTGVHAACVTTANHAGRAAVSRAGKPNHCCGRRG